MKKCHLSALLLAMLSASFSAQAIPVVYQLTPVTSAFGTLTGSITVDDLNSDFIVAPGEIKSWGFRGSGVSAAAHVFAFGAATSHVDCAGSTKCFSLSNGYLLFDFASSSGAAPSVNFGQDGSPVTGLPSIGVSFKAGTGITWTGTYCDGFTGCLFKVDRNTTQNARIASNEGLIPYTAPPDWTGDDGSGGVLLLPVPESSRLSLLLTGLAAVWAVSSLRRRKYLPTEVWSPVPRPPRK